MIDKQTMDVKTFLFICVSIALVIALGFIATNYYELYTDDIRNDGYLTGVNDSLIYYQNLLLSQAINCELISLGYGEDQTLNLVAVECLPEEVIQYLQQGGQNG